MNTITMSSKEIKEKLSSIIKKQHKIEKLIEKQEEDGVYDDALYRELDELEKQRLELEELNI